jgi:hypothetical protein
MKLLDLLIGKSINYMTEAKVKVPLEVKSVKEVHHSRDVGPSNAGNDWWPPQETWITIDIEFTNGFKCSYRSLAEIEVIN